jgi:serine/threonine protein kinase
MASTEPCACYARFSTRDTCACRLSSWAKAYTPISRGSQNRCSFTQNLSLKFLKFRRHRTGHQPFALPVLQDVARDILDAVSYIHHLSIIHTDLKTENVLLVPRAAPGAPWRVKLADFGSAVGPRDWRPPLVGTMQYRPPEMALQASRQGHSLPQQRGKCARADGAVSPPARAGNRRNRTTSDRSSRTKPLPQQASEISPASPAQAP